jgi:hypothetical protein
MSMLVQQCRRVLMVKDNYVDLVAGRTVAVNHDPTVNRVSHGEVFAKELDEVLFIDFTHQSVMRDRFRRQLELNGHDFLFYGKGGTKE